MHHQMWWVWLGCHRQSTAAKVEVGHVAQPVLPPSLFCCKINAGQLERDEVVVKVKDTKSCCELKRAGNFNLITYGNFPRHKRSSYELYLQNASLLRHSGTLPEPEIRQMNIWETVTNFYVFTFVRDKRK